MKPSWYGVRDIQCGGANVRNARGDWCTNGLVVDGGRLVTLLKIYRMGWNPRRGVNVHGVVRLKWLCPECLLLEDS